MYLDYVNNFECLPAIRGVLTVEVFAYHYSISEDLASMIIDQGRVINDLEAKAEKVKK